MRPSVPDFDAAAATDDHRLEEQLARFTAVPSRDDDVKREPMGGTPEHPVQTIRAARLRDFCEVIATVAFTSPAPGRIVALDVMVEDETGSLLCHFTGRRAIPGVVGGTRLRVAGTLVSYRSRMCLLNPAYELLGSEDESCESS